MIKEPKKTISKVSKMINNNHLEKLLYQLQDDGFEVYANLVYKGVVAGGINLTDFLVLGKGRAIVIDNVKKGRTKQRREIQILHKNEGWNHSIYISDVLLDKESFMKLFTFPMKEIMHEYNLPSVKNQHYRPFSKDLKDVKSKIRSSTWPFQNYDKLHIEGKIRKARRSFIKLLK